MRRVWSIRAYKEGDEDRALELLKAVYPARKVDREQWMAWWTWKYRDNPAGSSIMWFACSNDKLVGQYIIIPIKMKIGNKVIKGSQMVDLMTHPDYQHQGIFLTLARQALSDAGKKGLDIVYGFPNKPAYPGHLKSGWFEVCVLKTFIKPLNLRNILSKYIPNKFLPSALAASGNLFFRIVSRNKKPPKVDALEITPISFFDERIDDFWRRISNAYEIGVVRDRAYLNWRFVNRPDANHTIYLAQRNGEILGYVVLACREAQGLIFGYIVNIVTLPGLEDVFQCLISKAIEHLNNEKADLVLYQGIGNKMYGKILRKNGFISSRFLDKRFRFIARVNTSRVSETFLRNPRHWFVQIGDADTT